MKTVKTKKTIRVCTRCKNWCFSQGEVRLGVCPEQCFQETTLTFSTPLNKILKTGQPVLVGTAKAPRLFSHFDEDCLHTFGRTPSSKTISWYGHEWSLPTREELKTIGQADFGWLAAEDLEDE